MKQDLGNSEFPISVLEVAQLGIRENLSWRDKKKRTLSMLERFGLESLSHRNFFSLSGGEKQKVNFARCLLQDTALFLLDEPSSHLDIKAQEELIKLCQCPMVEKKAIILVSHDSTVFNALPWEVKKLWND
ncbi:MAG: ABC transporter ATP-binding protein [Sphaerochaetaceae bacterium]|nr:ABC transporter ATP-binding protein [Sphaerochaetaceae bacterium]